MKIDLKLCVTFLILTVYSCKNRNAENPVSTPPEIVQNEKKAPTLLSLVKEKTIAKPIAGGEHFQFTFNLPENYFTTKWDHYLAQALVDRMAGVFLFSKGKKKEAKPYFEDALNIYKTFGNEQMIASMNDKLNVIEPQRN